MNVAIFICSVIYFLLAGLILFSIAKLDIAMLTFFTFFILLGGYIAIVRFVRMYFLFMLKAAFIACATSYIVDGKLEIEEEGLVKNAITMVKGRFVAVNVMFLVDSLISGAVKQIQNALTKIGDWLSFIPGFKSIIGVINLLLGIVLGYIDECILAYIFVKKDQGAFKSALDGITIYGENWKKVLKAGAKNVVLVIAYYITSLIVFSLMFIPLFGKIFSGSGVGTIIGFVVTILFVNLVKVILIDDFILLSFMQSYLTYAVDAQPSVDLYEKFGKWSKKFRKIKEKAVEEDPGAFGQPSVAYTAATQETV